MTVLTSVVCNRCAKPENEYDCHWLVLTVGESEEALLAAPDCRIDLCSDCERDFVAFMSGEVFHKFVEQRK